jgi:hypothetical protein
VQIADINVPIVIDVGVGAVGVGILAKTVTDQCDVDRVDRSVEIHIGYRRATS